MARTGMLIGREDDHQPDGTTIPDPTWVASVVERLRGWPYGPVRVVSTVQIGGEHGLSGTVYRLTVDGEDGQQKTFILKQDGAPGIERALAFYASVADRPSGSIPACYGSEIEVRTRIEHPVPRRHRSSTPG